METLQKNKRERLFSLLKDVKQGKTDAMDLFVREVKQTVFSFGMKVCGGEVEDAEDTTQEVFIQFYKGVEKLEFYNSSALLVWLYRVAKNACIMSRRKNINNPELNLSIDDVDQHHLGLNRCNELFRNPEKFVLENEDKEFVRNALLELPIEYRLVLILRDMELLTTKETAEVMDISEENVRVRLHRARRDMKEKLLSLNQDSIGKTD